MAQILALGLIFLSGETFLQAEKSPGRKWDSNPGCRLIFCTIIIILNRSIIMHNNNAQNCNNNAKKITIRQLVLSDE